MKVLATYNIKGGVGKTAAAVNLAYLAADSGARKPTKRLDVLLRPLDRDYDFAFLDCPPSISLVSENVFRATDALLVPLIPTTLSMRTLAQLDAFLADHSTKHRPRILAFFSMVDRRKTLHRELVEKVRAERSDVLDTVIPASSDIERMGVHRAPLATYAPRARSTKAYRDLWAEIAARL